MTLAGRNAPVSFGVYGRPVATISDLPDRMLDAVAERRLRGLRARTGRVPRHARRDGRRASRERGLAAIGAYAPVHFAAGDDVVAADLARIELSCRELAACGGGLVILADEGSETLLSHPARPSDDRSLALDDAGWRRLASSRAARSSSPAATGSRSRSTPTSARTSSRPGRSSACSSSPTSA